MKDRLEELLLKGQNYLLACSEDKLRAKALPEKWSKIEILGHLIDSALNNLRRFTEIQFKEKPYDIRNYRQNELVKANDYQHADLSHLLNLWLALNARIAQLMAMQTAETLAYAITFEDGQRADLQFLMEDYVDHLAHHLRQIMQS